MYDTLHILKRLENTPLEDLALRLKIKLEIIEKQRIIVEKNPMNRLLELIKEKDNLFLQEYLQVPRDRSFFYSESIIRWTEEILALFEKAKKEDKAILNIFFALESVKVSATPKVVEDVCNKLDAFLEVYENYILVL